MMKIEIERGGGGLRLRVREIFESNKILTRQTADSIIATIDTNNYFYSNTIHGTIIKDDTFEIKFILSILNSNVLKYYYRQTTSEGGKVFAQVKIEILRQMPIKITEKLKQTSFVILVDYLLHLYNKENPAILLHTDNTRIASHLEDILNMMVYELYFEEHMKEVDLDVLQFVTPILESLQNLPIEQQIKELYEWYQKPENAVRQRIMLIDTRSPDILAVIHKSM